MNISGIRMGAGFYDYNTIKTDEIAKQQIEDAETAKELPTVGQKETEAADRETVMQEERESRADTGAWDFARRYQPEASYELKGSESDIKSLDVEKAISDMRKDQVLQQYQFFVGESQAQEILAATREKENFSL
ncbi:MAG: hypothetical protein PUA75_07780 [Clostridiales bacterium]|nr:hypothetical protein [Clostridiales bacterium]